MKLTASSIIFLMFLFNGFITNAQIPVIEWQKSVGGFISNTGDIANWVEQTTDKGYIVAGYANSVDGDVAGNHGLSDYWIVKFDSLGNIQWKRCYGGSNFDQAYCIKQTRDGGYIVSGYTLSSDGDITGFHGGVDSWIIKLDNLGNIQWQKCYGGSNNEDARAIEQTPDGGYIFGGSTNSIDGDVSGNHSAMIDYWIVKISSTGTLEWQKCLGSTQHDQIYTIKLTRDNGYVVAGFAGANDGDVTGYHAGRDYWVVKLGITGNIQWQKSLGGSLEDIALSIDQTSDDGFIVAGTSKSFDGDVTGTHANAGDTDSDYWVVKLDPAGNVQWKKCFGGTAIDIAYSVREVPSGGYIIGGTSTSTDGDVTMSHNPADFWLVKTDDAGIIEWQKSFGGSRQEELRCIQNTIDGGYIVVGYNNSGLNDGDVDNPHNNTNDYWLVKLLIPCIPVIDISVSANNICAGTAVTFSSVVSNGGYNPVYQWKKNGVNVGGDSSVFTSAILSDKDTIVCVLTSNAPCAVASVAATSDTIIMNVMSSTPPNLSISPGDPSICPGASLTFTAVNTGATNATYQWNLNGVAVPGATDSTYTSTLFKHNDIVRVNVAFPGSVCLIPIKDSVVVSVIGNLSPQVSLSASAMPVCASDTLTLTATTVNGGANTTYQWALNGSVIAGATDSFYTSNSFNHNDTIAVTVTNSFSGCTVSDSDSTVVAVNNRVTPSVSITVNTNNSCSAPVAKFTAVPVNGGSAPVYQWRKNGVVVGNQLDTFTDYSGVNGDVVVCRLTSNASCTSSDTALSNIIILNVPQLPAVNLGKDTIICGPVNLQISAGPGYKTYLWQDGSVNPGIVAAQAGSYYITVTDACNSISSDTITITQMPALPPFLPADTTTCGTLPFTINSSGNFTQYLWSTNATTPNLTTTTPGIYWLQVTTGNGCTGRDSIELVQVNCPQSFHIPSAFTPNGDGRNDFYKPYITGNITQYQFSVYNRYGDIVFTTNDTGKGWDGRVNGQYQRTATFVWVCIYESGNGMKYTKRGTVLIIN